MRLALSKKIVAGTEPRIAKRRAEQRLAVRLEFKIRVASPVTREVLADVDQFVGDRHRRGGERLQPAGLDSDKGGRPCPGAGRKRDGAAGLTVDCYRQLVVGPDVEKACLVQLEVVGHQPYDRVEVLSLHESPVKHLERPEAHLAVDQIERRGGLKVGDPLDRVGTPDAVRCRSDDALDDSRGALLAEPGGVEGDGVDFLGTREEVGALAGLIGFGRFRHESRRDGIAQRVAVGEGTETEGQHRQVARFEARGCDTDLAFHEPDGERLLDREVVEVRDEVDEAVERLALSLAASAASAGDCSPLSGVTGWSRIAASSVIGPTMPSNGSASTCSWNRATAWAVAGPKSPSTWAPTSCWMIICAGTPNRRFVYPIAALT